MAAKDRIVLPKNAGRKVKLITYTTETKKARLKALSRESGLTLTDLNNEALDILLKKAVVKE